MGNMPGLRELSRVAGHHQKALHSLASPPNPGFLLLLWSSGHSRTEGLCPWYQWMGPASLDQVWRAS